MYKFCKFVDVMIYVKNFKYMFLNKFGDMKIWMSILIEKKNICIL